MDALPPEIARSFQNAETWNNLGIQAATYDAYQSAAIFFQRACREYDSAAFHANLASVYRRLRRYPECLASARKALKLDPKNAPARFLIGCALLDENKAEEAANHLAYLGPDDPPFSRFVRAMCLLHAGRIKEGLAEYDARLEIRPFTSRLPLWNGEPYKHLAIHAEQGLGDSIMFSRYLKGVENYTLGMHGPLVRLFQEQGIPCVSMNEDLPQADFFCPLMSLPNRLGRSDYAPEPYIRSRKRYPLPPLPGLRVGIVWASKATGKDVGKEEASHGRAKSVPLEFLLQLGEIQGVQLYSLQTGEARQEIGYLGAQHLIVQMEILDFSDMAAWMAELDYIVSVDTAPAHLAGAMGKPGMVLLNYQGAWQWQSDIASPWYPSLDVVRQTEPDNWQTCIDQAKVLLTARVRASGRGVR